MILKSNLMMAMVRRMGILSLALLFVLASCGKKDDDDDDDSSGSNNGDSSSEEGPEGEGTSLVSQLNGTWVFGDEATVKIERSFVDGKTGHEKIWQEGELQMDFAYAYEELDEDSWIEVTTEVRALPGGTDTEGVTVDPSYCLYALAGDELRYECGEGIESISGDVPTLKRQ